MISVQNNDYPALVDSKQNTLSIESFFIDSSDVKYSMIQYIDTFEWVFSRAKHPLKTCLILA